MKEFCGIHYYATDDLLNHPCFLLARSAYIDAIMAMYESKPPMIELMSEGGRILVFGITMCLWGAYRDSEPDTWPTVARLKAALALFPVVSPRQIDNILARLVQTGYVTLAPAPRDARLRLVLPTEQMIAHDREWLRAHYLPHACLFGEAAYALPLARDPDFQREQHAAAISTFAAAADNVVQNNAAILQFLTRSAGLLVLMKLIQQMRGAEAGETALSYSDIGLRFGVSRTHVRNMLADAAREGHVMLDPPGRVRLMPSLLAAFDFHLANGMSLHDLGHNVAVARLQQHSERVSAAAG